MQIIHCTGNQPSISALQYLFILLITLCSPVDVSARQADSTYSLLSRENQHLIIPYQVLFHLPDKFILAQSESISSPAGPLIRNTHYHINYDTGQIALINAYNDTLRITASYLRLPIPLQSAYTHREMLIEHVLSDTLPSNTRQGSVFQRIAQPLSPTNNRSTLRAGGSKTFSVISGSNRDASLEQSLRIQIAGKASKDIEVLAILSDKSNPIQPDGNTRQLRELDQVFIQVKTPSTTSTMGDHTIEINQPIFAKYQRKIKGVQGLIKFPNGTFQMAAAVSEGEYKSNIIAGIEGVQGPYQLSGGQDNLNIFVISGTEKVWVDGVRMTRGQDNDYIIDYTNGQITFTRNRLITGDSRIGADYEASEQQYQRNVYVGRGDFSVGKNTRFGTTFIREGDNKNAFQNQSLSQLDPQSLPKQTTTQNENRVSGVKFVGSGEGSYALKTSTDIEKEYYEFVGENLGDYEVVFTRVKQGEGTYLYRENNRYEFVGQSQGDFIPETFLYLPTSHALAGFDISSEPVHGLNISSEFAVSTDNPNINPGTLDQQIQQGNAYNLSADFESEQLVYGGRSIGLLKFQSTFRKVDAKFKPSGRIDEIEYHRRYGQPAGASWQGQLSELSATHTLRNTLKIKGGMGRFNNHNGFSSQRQEIGLNFTPQPLINFSYRYEKIQTNDIILSSNTSTAIPLSSMSNNGRWVRQYFSGRIKLGNITPYVGIDKENRLQKVAHTLDSGKGFIELKSGLEYKPSKRFTSTTHFTHRRSDIVDHDSTNNNYWLKESIANTIQQRIAVKGLQTFSAFVNLTHRSRVFKEVPGENSHDQMVDSRILFSPLEKALTIESRYEISNERSSQRSRRYVQVGRGRGKYRLDALTGDYIQDSDGEYIERFDQIGLQIPITSIKTSFRFQSDLHRLFSSRKKRFNLLKYISSDTYFSVEERSKSENKTDLYLLKLSQFQQDSTTVFGNLTFRQDFFLFPQRRNMSLRLRYRKNSLLNNQLISGSEHRFQSGYSIRFRTALAPRTTAELHFARERKRRRDFGLDRLNLLSHNGSIIFANRPRPPLEVRVRIIGQQDADRINEISATLLGIIPEVSYAFKGKGRIRFEVDWSHVHTSDSTTFLPFDMAKGRRVGHSARWLSGMDYRLGENFSLLMQYDGRKDPIRPTIHTGRAEVRAFF